MIGYIIGGFLVGALVFLYSRNSNQEGASEERKALLIAGALAIVSSSVTLVGWGIQSAIDEYKQQEELKERLISAGRAY